MRSGTVLRSAVVGVALPALLAGSGVASAQPDHGDRDGRGIDHIVVIYEENHSFDNLYGSWEGVDGLRRARPQVQVAPDGTPLACLPQNDVNLTSPPLPVSCTGTIGSTPVSSAFANRPFEIGDFIAPADTTCPTPGQFVPTGVPKGQGLPGGCTRDLVHRFYNEQYQINGGRMDRYVAGSDAVGLVMGTYDTRELPIYEYLHGRHAPDYAIADHFFQAAFGGSFLNHQWLITPTTPAFPNAVRDGSANDLHSVVGPDGFPAGTPLHPATPGTADRALTQAANPDGSCAVPAGMAAPPAGTVCGDFAINTIQPFDQPYAPGTPVARRLPALTTPTIGDRLSAGGVDWAWYAGGWDNAAGNVNGPGWTNGSTPGTCTNPQTAAGAAYPFCPDALFQFHHAPFSYFANYGPGTPGRAAHLKDEVEFIAAAKAGHLKPVSFVKPVGEENEHPGYASQDAGSRHLVDLIKAVENGPDAQHTLIVVTYDENGGQWDHVAPPAGRHASEDLLAGSSIGIADQWGPGTRIPALLISPQLRRSFSVDHTSHDTTSIMATIERRFHLPPISTRDAQVADLFTAFH